MTQKGWIGYFFEDFHLGMKLQGPTPRTLTDGETSLYIALTGDRTPRFCGPQRLVHPLIIFHTVFGQTVRQISLNARANLGYADMRWMAPVHVGDTLSIQMEIIGLKENSSRDTGIVYVKNVAYKQDGTEVMRFTRWVMVRKRSDAPTPYLDAPEIPKLPKVVPPEELSLFEEHLPTLNSCGGRWSFDDYVAGERIFHFDGMTMNDSDHMSFTRLFQNSAKVHFDSHKMNGRPLLYGGLTISHGYAQAFNGLEMRLGIRALNSGVHANPTYSGDTLYTFTDVLETVSLTDPNLGALRLRMVVTKDLDAAALAEQGETFSIMQEHPKKPGKKQHHPQVVLDLDYWEVLPRRAALLA
ncbi:MAG: hypothetical protein H6728_06095 [Myxococcales bacterium]|nr:hypothetical protein [Myxococcales bacterium]